MVIPDCRADCLRVTHPFAARLGIATVLARLACIKHATSVRSEPGSNSSYVSKFFLARFKFKLIDLNSHSSTSPDSSSSEPSLGRIPSVNRYPDFSLSLFVVVTVVRSEANCIFPRPRFQAPRAKKVGFCENTGLPTSKTKENQPVINRC